MKGLVCVVVGALMGSVVLNVSQSNDNQEQAASSACASCRAENAAANANVALSPQQEISLISCCKGANCGTRGASLRDEVAAKMTELEGAIDAVEVDEQEIFRLADELGELRDECLRTTVHNILTVKRTLTPEQMVELRGTSQN